MEEFKPSSASAAKDKPDVQLDMIETARSEGFERGYASGWDDAAKAADEARRKIDAELARNIQNLGFTFHEATCHLRGEILELVDQIAVSFIPEVLPELLRETVKAHLREALEEGLNADLQVVGSPDACAVLKDLLEADADLDFKLVEESTLAQHQVFVKFGGRAIEIDFSGLLSAFQAQIVGLQASDEKEAVHD